MKLLRKMRKHVLGHVSNSAESMQGPLRAIAEHLAALRTDARLTGDDDVRSVKAYLDTIAGHLAAIRLDTWRAKEAAITASLFPRNCNHNSTDSRYLPAYYGQVYSQSGEDGIVAEIFRRIGEGSRTFLEIGVSDGLENTTRLLLEQGWAGVWIEGSDQYVAKAKVHFREYIEKGKLRIVHGFVRRDNVNDMIRESGLPSEIDYLSVDIDYNTSHVWRAIKLRSRVACIEYNASLPPSSTLEVPYEADFTWDGTNWFGASLGALEQIGRQKSMALVGCDFTGVNGYFVNAEEVGDHFIAPFTAVNHFEPPRYSIIDHRGHPRSLQSRVFVTTS